MNASSSERRIALSGTDAAEWLGSRGWILAAGGHPSQIYADEVRQGDFVARRLWVSAVAGQWAPVQHDLMQLTLMIEGSLDITVGRRESRIRDGYAIRRVRGQDSSFTSLRPIALMQIETRGIPAALASTHTEHPAVFEAHPALREMLAGLMSSLLNSDINPSMAEFAYLKRSIEYTAMALLIGNGPRENPIGSSSERRLHQKAVNLILTGAADPDLNLDEVAAELNVSRSYLQRAFRGTGSTPHALLLRTRVLLARDLLQEKRVTDRDELEAIAHQAGFSSSRAMRDALRREGTTLAG